MGSNTEAVSLAISQICRASVRGVLVCSDQCFEVACRANRQQKVRAVVVEDSNDVQAAREQVNANVFCVSPRSIPLYSIRNLFREITRLKPSPQEGWSD
ncbi:RpiB/LacA/LacB family sugar-phosphate isomerase [Thalassoroseus pseudoceratinae]|uniref:RpiB/LacA/LacB family sugar-phosphate isomerase n=1 Tax=Thalassoroseus pseudoceratinae TaxID=2713176 RepID=UPI0036F27D79